MVRVPPPVDETTGYKDHKTRRAGFLIEGVAHLFNSAHNLKWVWREGASICD
jgi:hypothetical protein